jgi:tetratricopeptide (TPR) repeat protein
MVRSVLQATGVMLALAYGSGIAWLYLRQPRSLAELKTQASVEANFYQINQENFAEGIKEFGSGDYNSAVGQFTLADPARKDPTDQYYLAYCYYLLGRGHIFNDADTFKKGLDAVNRCLDSSPNHIFEIDRGDLEIRNADSLRQTFVDGLKRTPPSLNPLNWFNKK